jgi:glycosyltransferase involved in cell wall biosynthesis
MNILYLTAHFPYPGNVGSGIKSRKLLDYFCSKHTVTVITLLKGDDVDNITEFEKIYKRKVRQLFCFKIDKQRSVINFICSLFMRIPLSIYRNYNSSIVRKISNILFNESVDVIFCNHLIMAQYVPLNYHHKTILLEHNTEYLIWKRFSSIEKNILKKIVGEFEAFRMFRYEIAQCNKISKVMAAPNDIAQLKLHAPFNTKFFLTYHLGVDDLLNEDALIHKKNHRLVFIGSMTWEPNQQAIRWFIENVYSLIKEKIPDISLVIVGKYDTPFISNDIDKSVQVLGFVSDIRKIYDETDIFICPLQYGSGMKVKVIDAMYRGLPMVTTSIGAESIDLIDGENCFIADTAEDFTNKTIILLNSTDLWIQFSKKSRELAFKQYRWDSEYQRLDALLDNFM